MGAELTPRKRWTVTTEHRIAQRGEQWLANLDNRMFNATDPTPMPVDVIVSWLPNE